jgi:putative phosphoribosyl transferase
MFRDRHEAGRLIAERLVPLKADRPVVLALPRGGVVVGFEIAARLRAPLDIVLVRKIGAPFEPELAIGAVVDGPSPQVVLNEDLIAELGISRSALATERDRQLLEIERRRNVYLRGRAPQPVEGRTVIVVDDGIATGATMRAALAGLRQAAPGRLVLAAPVAPAETAARLQREVDDLVILETPDEFGALGFFYEDFHQLDDREVIRLLDEAASHGWGAQRIARR